MKPTDFSMHVTRLPCMGVQMSSGAVTPQAIR